VYNTAHNPKMEVNARAERLRIRLRGKSTVAAITSITEEREVY